MKKEALRVVFFGTPDFALPTLELIFRRCELLALVCQPDKARGRGHKLSPCPTKAFAIEAGIPTFTPTSLKTENEELGRLLSFLEKAKADVFVVVAYGKLIPDSLLSIPRLGPFNIHASLLPRWRGAAPIQRCIEAGDNETGVCIQKMVSTLDAGNIYKEHKEELDENTQAPELFESLALDGAGLFENFIEDLTQPDFAKNPGLPQDPKLVTFAPKIRKEEGAWSPEWSTIEFHNKVRAFRGWPSVYTRCGAEHNLKILATELSKENTKIEKNDAGIITLKDGEVFVCGSIRAGEQSSVLKIKVVQPANRAPIDASTYFENLLKSGQEELRLIKPLEGSKQ